jgi:glucose-6-phosphate 1-epimerase
MSDIEILNNHFAMNSQIQFKELADGVVVMEIDNPHATATISLYGGNVVQWRPKQQVEPVLWVSKLAQFRYGKAIRGGVPICWPWFGAHPSNAKLPAHGYARISPWKVLSVQNIKNGATEITLALSATDLSRDHGPQSARLSVQITVGEILEIALTTINEGDHSFVLSEGLHTYFKVGDIASISVLGLDGSDYVDLLSKNLLCQQHGSIKFNGEVGRIYVNTRAVCVIEDPSLNRRIRIEKSGSLSTAVWNPWARTAAKMDDLGPEGWCDMVCVESANALENEVTVGAGQSHTITASYSAEYIS